VCGAAPSSKPSAAAARAYACGSRGRVGGHHKPFGRLLLHGTTLRATVRSADAVAKPVSVCLRTQLACTEASMCARTCHSSRDRPRERAAQAHWPVSQQSAHNHVRYCIGSCSADNPVLWLWRQGTQRNTRQSPHQAMAVTAGSSGQRRQHHVRCFQLLSARASSATSSLQVRHAAHRTRK